MRAVHAEGGVIPPFKRDIGSQIFTIIPVLAGYLKFLFLPTGLTIAHKVEIYHTVLAFSVIFSSLILLLYLLNAIYLYTLKEMEWRILSFFMIWYFITLLIIIIVPLNSILQENRAYISGIGFAIFLGIIIGKLAYSGHRIKLAYGLLSILIVLYGIGTYYRNTTWRDGVTVWTDAMNKSPYESLPYNNLGVAYKNKGDYVMAREIFYKGIRLAPNEWILHYNLANVFRATKEFDLALEEYDRAIRLNPLVPPAYDGKGYIHLFRGEIEESAELFRKAIDIKPDYASAHYNMGIAMKRLGRFDDARRELTTALYYASMSNAEFNKILVKKVEQQLEGGEGSGMENGVYEDVNQ